MTETTTFVPKAECSRCTSIWRSRAHGGPEAGSGCSLPGAKVMPSRPRGTGTKSTRSGSVCEVRSGIVVSRQLTRTPVGSRRGAGNAIPWAAATDDELHPEIESGTSRTHERVHSREVQVASMERVHPRPGVGSAKRCDEVFERPSAERRRLEEARGDGPARSAAAASLEAAACARC